MSLVKFLLAASAIGVAVSFLGVGMAQLVVFVQKHFPSEHNAIVIVLGLVYGIVSAALMYFGLEFADKWKRRN